MNLRLGVGDSKDGSNDKLDWALFAPFGGFALGDYEGQKIWTFGGESMANNGYKAGVTISGLRSMEHLLKLGSGRHSVKPASYTFKNVQPLDAPPPPRAEHLTYVTLGPKYQVASHTYEFQMMKLSAKVANNSKASYSVEMIKECEKSGMKPICNMGYAQGSCKNDPHALYLGNYYEISYGPYRRITSWFPRGWEGVSGPSKPFFPRLILPSFSVLA